ncbi:hypothetical protein JR316_0008600 [Psilocybe cubensis]|uniref:Ribosomal RNA methyltransferase FtsJ domain-containing protein n=2 Tax=Psilocybe cubensis TaxID=181762 RepID=A0A8H7XXJ1_PSICU|nr:hypothetical protein JR316_0008600 [Psilocybe cubensis]KAH9478147.1 hypothetical protein JR316_0008600 [Psilocybe cubensis]
MDTGSPRSRPHEQECERELVRLLVEHGATDLERLIILQDKGWNDTTTELHFRKQRHTSDTCSPKLNLIWFKRMKILFREIDSNVDVVSFTQDLVFLDLGCSPGGFSSYILENNPNAIGTGVSLPVEEGGHEFLLESDYLTRFHLLSANLTYFELGPHCNDTVELHRLPMYMSVPVFDLVLLDGHQLRTQTTSVPWDRDRLLISQVIIGLKSVRQGGTLVVKLPLPHRHIAARIIFLLRILSNELVGWKPLCMHANRGQFYAVAKGVGEGKSGGNLQNYVEKLGLLWSALTFGGEDNVGRAMVPEDLDFIISMNDLRDHHLEWLLEYGKAFWKVQANAMERFYLKKGIY